MLRSPAELKRVSRRRGRRTSRAGLQPLRALLLSEVAVEGSKWEMAGFTRRLEPQAVRKTQRALLSEPRESGFHHVGVLQCEIFVIKEHFDRGDNACGVTLVH